LQQTDNYHNLQDLSKSTQHILGQEQWQRTSKWHWSVSVHVVPTKLQLLRSTTDCREAISHKFVASALTIMFKVSSALEDELLWFMTT